MKPSSFGFLLFAGCLLAMGCGTPLMPEWAGVDNVKVSQVGLSRSTLNLDLHAYNPNNYVLILRAMDLDISIDNRRMGHTAMDSLIRIPARDSFQIPVSINVEMKNVFNNALSLAFKDSVDLKLEGSVTAGRPGLLLKRKVQYEGKQSTSAFIK